MALFDLKMDQGPVAEIILNRPEKYNALAASFWHDFPQAMTEIDKNPAIRAVILSANGDHFSAGMDLDFFATIDAKRQEEEGRFREWLRREILRLQQAVTIVEDIRIPVICVLQGACIGGALDLICAANIRYATQDAYFSIHEINIGMTADLGTLQRLPKLIPAGYVHEMALTGQKMSAQTALKAGLVTEIFADHDAAMAHARKTAQTISEKSPLAIAGTKIALNHSRDHAVGEGLLHMANWNAGMFITEDLALGMKAQKSKTQADFKDMLPLTPKTEGKEK